MIYTEEEAKKRWCPMVRLNVAADATANGPWNRDGGDTNCIASDCMMWKWVGLGKGDCGLSRKA